MRQLADPLAVHRQEGCIGCRYHIIPLLLQLHQCGGSDSLHLGDNQIGLLLLYDFAKFGAVQHRQHIAAMSHLHRRGVLVPVKGHDLYTITLQLYCNLFPQFSRTAQQCFLCHFSEWSSYLYHIILTLKFLHLRRFFPSQCGPTYSTPYTILRTCGGLPSARFWG